MTRIGLIGTVPNPLKRTGLAPELASDFPDFQLRGYPSRVPVFPYTPMEQAMQHLGHADAAMVAVDDDCAAVVIDSVGDYGLAAMRAMLAVPAIGSGEAGMAEAAIGGRRFGIVTVWAASMNFIVEDLLKAYGHTGHCIGIYNVGGEDEIEAIAGPDGYLSQVREQNAGVLGRVERGVEAMAERGAEAILLGCTCMSAMAGTIAARAPVPVINPLAAGIRAATLAAGSVTPPNVHEGRRELLAKMVGAVADEVAEDCPVCIVADSFT